MDNQLQDGAYGRYKGYENKNYRGRRPVNKLVPRFQK